MNEVRAEIAAAASQLDGVTVTAHYRQSPKPLDGFVKWNGRTRGDNGLGWMDSWQVWVVLPQDVKAAEAWLNEHLDQLVADIDGELIVTSAAPAELLLGTNPTNGLIIEGTRPAA